MIWCWPNLSTTSDLLKRYGVRQIGIVGDEPISLEEAREHLRIDTDDSPPVSDDDPWLTDIGIPAARDWCEHFLGRPIAQQMFEISTNAFPTDSIMLPFGPVLMVDSVIYTDTDSVEQTFSDTDYELDYYVDPPQIRLVYGSTWPTALDTANSVKVRFVTGYNLADDSPQTVPLPAGIRAAMLLVLGHLFMNRENTVGGPSIAIQDIPLGAAALLERYRLRLSMA